MINIRFVYLLYILQSFLIVLQQMIKIHGNKMSFQYKITKCMP